MELDKRIIFLIVIFIVAISAGLFFYLQQDIVPEELGKTDDSINVGQNDCIISYKNIADRDDFLESIKPENIEFSEEISIEQREEKIASIYNKTIKYLLCEVRYDAKGDFYNQARSFIVQDTGLSEENSQKILFDLDEAASSGLGKTFIRQLAFGNWDQLCPDKINNMCINNINEMQGLEAEDVSIFCPDYCQLVEEYRIDKERFNKEILDYNYWRSTFFAGLMPIDARIRIRLAILIRIAGIEDANQFCLSLPEEEQDGFGDTLKGICLTELSRIIDPCKEQKDELIKDICLDDF